jgi:hypothetical protein
LVEQLKALILLHEMRKLKQLLWKIAFAISYQVKPILTYDPAISLPGIYVRQMKQCPKDLYPNVESRFILKS